MIKIYKLNTKGDELVSEVDVVSEAEEILREAAEKGSSFIPNLTKGGSSEQNTLISPDKLDELLEHPDLQSIHIMYPMMGG